MRRPCSVEIQNREKQVLVRKFQWYCITGIFYRHLIFAIIALPMIAPKYHPSNKHPAYIWLSLNV